MRESHSLEGTNNLLLSSPSSSRVARTSLHHASLTMCSDNNDTSFPLLFSNRRNHATTRTTNEPSEDKIIRDRVRSIDRQNILESQIFLP